MEIKREYSGKNILILEKMTVPRKLWSQGKTMFYVLIHKWLRDENDHTSVLGQDLTHWTKREGENMIKTGLFANVDLF